jgi:hypothetical protein
MQTRSNTSRCPESEQLKQLALLVRQGRLLEVQESLSAGKPFRPTSYRSAKPLRDAARTGFYSIIGLFLRQSLAQAELNEVLEEVVQLGREAIRLDSNHSPTRIRQNAYRQVFLLGLRLGSIDTFFVRFPPPPDAVVLTAWLGPGFARS